MNIKIYKDYQQASDVVAQIMLGLIHAKSHAVICLASGDSGALACELFCRKVKEENIDISKIFLIDLDETTLTVGRKYFKEKVVLKKGITLGLADVMAARQVVLMANGEQKAEVIKRTVRDDGSNQIPVTIL